MTRRPAAVPGGRRLRSSVATVEVVGLSAVGHVAAGGPVPDIAGLLALLAVVGGVSAALRQRLLGLRPAVGLVVLGQVAVHSGLTLTGAHAGHAAVAHDTGMALEPAMLLAHAASAVVTLAAFLWQEQVLVVLGRAWAWPGTTYAPVSPPAHPVLPARPGGSFGDLLAREVPRRGPPAVLLAR